MVPPVPADEGEQMPGLNSIIQRLLEVRGSRPGKAVQLTEKEIRDLCTHVSPYICSSLLSFAVTRRVPEAAGSARA